MRSDDKLEADIRRELSFLFEDHAARVICKEYYAKSFGNALVVVEFATIRLRADIDRGSLSFEIAPSHAPTDWVPARIVLAAVTDGDPLYDDAGSWVKLRDTLKHNFDALLKAFSPEEYDQKKAIMRRIEDEVTKTFWSDMRTLTDYRISDGPTLDRRWRRTPRPEKS